MSKLLPAAKIVAMIADVGKKGAVFAKLIHDTAVQTVMHAEQHGDITLADNLIQTLRKTTPGYVWQGLVLWYGKFSPIRWDKDGKVQLLRKDDKGYKPFDVAEATAKPAAEAREVQNRTNRPIEPMSIAMIKGFMARKLTEIDKAVQAGGRGVKGDPDTLRVFVKSTLAFMDKVAVIEEKVIPTAELPANGEDREKAAA